MSDTTSFIGRGTTDCIKRDGMGNGIDRDGI
jgi:hypothetical protein